VVLWSLAGILANSRIWSRWFYERFYGRRLCDACVGAILPAIISAISAGVVAFSQSQIKTGGEAIALESRRRLIGWVGGLMFIFFLLYFFGLYCISKTTGARRLALGLVRSVALDESPRSRLESGLECCGRLRLNGFSVDE
jgi:hypothetical protein